MSPQRIFGIVALIIGIVLMILGMNASHSVADQLTNTFTGHFTDATTWYILGGLALTIFGFFALFMGSGKGVMK